ncbi:MAG: hypothetical protein DGJ47_000450 [Rickettsiaceae bacterium]
MNKQHITIKQAREQNISLKYADNIVSIASNVAVLAVISVAAYGILFAGGAPIVLSGGLELALSTIGSAVGTGVIASQIATILPQGAMWYLGASFVVLPVVEAWKAVTNTVEVLDYVSNDFFNGDDVIKQDISKNKSIDKVEIYKQTYGDTCFTHSYKKYDDAYNHAMNVALEIPEIVVDLAKTLAVGYIFKEISQMISENSVVIKSYNSVSDNVLVQNVASIVNSGIDIVKDNMFTNAIKSAAGFVSSFFEYSATESIFFHQADSFISYEALNVSNIVSKGLNLGKGLIKEPVAITKWFGQNIFGQIILSHVYGNISALFSIKPLNQHSMEMGMEASQAIHDLFEAGEYTVLGSVFSIIEHYGEAENDSLDSNISGEVNSAISFSN